MPPTTKTLALCLALGLLTLGCDSASTDSGSGATSLAQADAPADADRGGEAGSTLAMIRRASAHYHRVEAALGAGYEPASPCVESPAGGMGYHYANFGLIDGTVDPSAPEILLYEPQRNGKLRLVAVEFMVASEAWDPAHDGPPTLVGEAFDDHRAEGAIRHGIPFPHYDLHVWVWRHNPSGMFESFNPNVSC